MLNRVMLIGHLGGDPEVKESQRGNKLASFSMATSRRWRDKTTGERQERTEWHRVVVFDAPIVETVVPTLKKGSRVYLQGELSTRKYEKNGEDRYITEVVVPAFSGALINVDAMGGGYAGGDINRDDMEEAYGPR